MADVLAPIAVRSRETPAEAPIVKLGPLEKVYVIWLAGGSCDGCSIAVLGATNPPLEHLLAGIVPGLPRIDLVHTAVSVEAGDQWVQNLLMAERGELDAPFAVVVEGSIMDETRSGEGFWVAVGEEEGRPVPTTEWVKRLVPKAAAVIAIGTCASWGGIPAAEGNVTGAMGVMDLLGPDYRSTFGVPVVNVPGCSPIGDNFVETVAAILLFLQGLAPLPEFDELGRPAWLYGETVHRHCPRAGYYEEGVFAKEYGDKECLVELGCWGPVVYCNITERGIVNGMGGCMQMGGICIGCTMPGFPDKFSPFYSQPPGAGFSTAMNSMVGGVIRRMRRLTVRDKNRERRWGDDQKAPSGWARELDTPGLAERGFQLLSKKLQNRIGEKTARGWRP